MKIKPFKAEIPKVGNLFSIALFFENVKEDYQEYKARGFFERAEEEQLFIYEYKDEERAYTGLICVTDIQDYTKGAILKHEDTLIEKEERQIKLAVERNGLIKPVLLTYPASDRINKLLKNFKSDNDCIYTTLFKGTQHTFWGIKNKKEIEEIVQLFDKKVGKSYIADGHHRSAAVSTLYHQNKSKISRALYTIYLADNEMKVSNWNRVITNIEGYSALGLVAALSNCFNMRPIAEPFQPETPRTLVLFIEGEWFELTWKTEILKKYVALSVEQRFDISIFNEEVAKKLLGITDVRSDSRLDHIDSRKGLDGLQRTVEKGNGLSVGFVFSPLELNDLFNVANAGKIMPPKSTFMLPRMQNGMLAYSFDHEKK